MQSSNPHSHSRSSDPTHPQATPTSHPDRAHRDRPSPPASSTSARHLGNNNNDDGTDDSPQPKGKLGSYQMRQGLQFNMETPKFLQQLKAQVGGNTSTRFTATASQSAADSEAKRRRAIQGEAELDDDGPLVVMPNDATGSEMDERDLERLRILHPNAVVDGRAPEEPAVVQTRSGPPVDSKSGKLLFQAKTSGSGATGESGKVHGAVSVGKKVVTGRDKKESPAVAKSVGKAKKKGGSHLLSFDE
ncbi:hypothetical protein BCR44DRAFT_50113 [Catenaria anguillulae PL171]|uniref:DUF4604 domain-containing protein n=1 Tax=Catenaria anguillulae PL171 TaxID=765915 RepID=A0A1Y2HAQ0_9FUNG|nr:hypothetical protein BCR44DRAFT_50113 [Catenaria anguillulae PL171]